MDDNGNFEDLKAEETLSYVQGKLDENKGDTVNYDTKNGKMVINEKNNLFITNEGLKDEDNLYSKISDEPVVNQDAFGELFNNTKANYEIPLREAILRNEKLSEKIKQFHPEINSLTLVSDVGNTYVYTDSGNSTSYTTSFVSSANNVLFSTKYGQNKFVYSHTVLSVSERVTVIQDSVCSKPLLEVLEESLLFVSKYPKSLTAEQLLDKFESESVTSYGGKTYEAKIDGINYFVFVTNNSGNRTIRIAVE